MDVFKTSYLRSNVIAWLPIDRDDKVLYFGDEDDVIAEKLRQMSDEVVCAEQMMDNDKCMEKHSFSYVICLGKLPRLKEMNCNRIAYATDVVCLLKEFLTTNGKFIWALPNRLGLKFWAGTKEEGTHAFFAGLENRLDEVSGFSRRELDKILTNAKVGAGKVYYPFPDYRFAMSVYSDEYLPKKGELIDQIGNFDEERLTMFDESLVMDSIVEEGLFQSFSNSFLAVVGNETIECVNQEQEEICYVKFSNDRGVSHNIRTYITKSSDGKMHLLKQPDSDAAGEQIKTIEDAYQRLNELYADSRFSLNRYMRREKGVELEFVSGHTMEEIVDGYLEAGEDEQACRQILAVTEEMRKCKDLELFQNSEPFVKVFGCAKLPEGLMAAPYSDIDMILPNILLTETDWTVIDYEWSFDFPIPMNFIIYRMIHYYVDTTEKRQKLLAYNLYQKAGITEQELTAYAAMEQAFQNYILTGHTPLRMLYDTEGKPVYHVNRVLNEIRETERRQALVFYMDKGNGFTEEDTVAYRCEALDGEYQLTVTIPQDVQALRMDPGNEAVTVTFRKLYWKGEPERVMEFVSNGHELEKGTYLFDTRDPNLLLPLPKSRDRTLVIDLKIETMSLLAAEWIAPKVDLKYQLKKMLKKQ